MGAHTSKDDTASVRQINFDFDNNFNSDDIRDNLSKVLRMKQQTQTGGNFTDIDTIGWNSGDNIYNKKRYEDYDPDVYFNKIFAQKQTGGGNNDTINNVNHNDLSDDEGYHEIEADIMGVLKNHIIEQKGGDNCPCDNNFSSTSVLSENPIKHLSGGGRKPKNDNNKKNKKKEDEEDEDDEDLEKDLDDDDDDDDENEDLEEDDDEERDMGRQKYSDFDSSDSETDDDQSYKKKKKKNIKRLSSSSDEKVKGIIKQFYSSATESEYNDYNKLANKHRYY